MDLMQRKNSKIEDEEVKVISKEIEEIQSWYSLGNQLRSGLFGQDACAQTDVSELPMIKRLSEETAELVKAMDSLKKEIAVKVKFIEAQYESRLQEEAETFYTSINYKVKAFESHQKEKISVLRNSYQQQLADAIEVVKASYKNYYMKKDAVIEEAIPSDTGRVRDLLNELQEKNFKIECMSEQLREYEEKALLEISSGAADDPEKAWLKTENARLKDDVDALHNEMEHVCQALAVRDQRLKHLASDISQLQSKVEEEKKALEKLLSENEELKMQVNLEKENGRKKMAKLRQDMKKEMESMESSHQEEILASERKREEDRQAKQKAQRQRELQARAQEAELKAQAGAIPLQQFSDEKQLVEELQRLRNTETMQRHNIDRLQKQMDRSNRAWEKKFEILKQNFHAIKNEMFLRQSLQRQAATLHQASVSYAADVPVLCQDTEGVRFKRGCFSTGAPLPSIGTGALQSVGRTDKTKSIHELRGRGADISTITESEGVSEDVEEDNEELARILSLPPPPDQQMDVYTAQV